MNNEKAFTMVEILVVLAIFALISSIIIGGLMSGNKIKDAQESIIEIQQNLRVPITLMTRDIRMAGFELAPHWDNLQQRTLNQMVGGTTGPHQSNSFSMQYLATTTAGGFPNSAATVTYSVDAQGNLIRTYIDGVNYGTIDKPPASDTIATNIDAMWISYLDNSGNWNAMPVNPPTTVTSWMGVPVTRAVSITIVAKGSKQNRMTNNNPVTFTEPRLPAGVIPPLTLNDGFDHRMVSTIVQLNNLNSRL